MNAIQHRRPLDCQQSFIQHVGLGEDDGKILRSKRMSWVKAQSLVVVTLRVRKLALGLLLNSKLHPFVCLI